MPDRHRFAKRGRLALATALAALLLMTGCGGGERNTTAGATQGTTSAHPTASAEPTASTTRPDRIEIPTIGVHAPVLPVGLTAEGALDVPPLDRPGETGWYDQGPVPGETGPAVVVGHVDAAKEPAVFFRLRELRPGDQIRITRTDAVTVTFRVVSVEQAPKNNFPTDRVYGEVDHAALRLITCGGTFDSARRSYTSNVIVYAVVAS